MGYVLNKSLRDCLSCMWLCGRIMWSTILLALVVSDSYNEVNTNIESCRWEITWKEWSEVSKWVIDSYNDNCICKKVSPELPEVTNFQAIEELNMHIVLVPLNRTRPNFEAGRTTEKVLNYCQAGRNPLLGRPCASLPPSPEHTPLAHARIAPPEGSDLDVVNR